MKNLLSKALLFACFYLLTSAINAQTISLAPAFSITLDPPSRPFILGSPIEITATVKVLSKTPIPWTSVMRNTTYNAFDFHLKSASTELERNAFYMGIRGQKKLANLKDLDRDSIALTLLPGTSEIYSIDVSKLYDLKTPGTYVLTLERLDENTRSLVILNTLTFKVVSNPPSH